MSNADKLAELAALCKGGVSVSVNEHRNCYESVRSALDGPVRGEKAGIPLAVRAEMIARDTMVTVQFYPNTPVGFHIVHHYDIGAALDAALHIMRTEHQKASE